MKAKRDELAKHLSHLYCGGQIGEVVLEDQFKAAAMSTDHELFIHTEGMGKVEPLPEAVGILDLALLISTLGTFGEDGNEQIALEFEDNRIVVTERDRGTVKLVTTAPKTIQTRIEDPAVVAQIMGMFPKDAGIVLPQSTVEALSKSLRLLKSDIVKVSRTKKGTTFIVGNSESNQAMIELPAGKTRPKEEEFDLVLSADKVRAVLSQIVDFSSTQIGFTGKDSLVFIWDDKFVYGISPREES